MVRLLEYQVKELIKRAGLPLPKQFSETQISDSSIYPIVVKSQVPIGGRGKSGGIKFANDPKEAQYISLELKRLKIEGFLPETLLYEEKLTILHEYYCGFLVNRDNKTINFIFSKAGGIDIEKIEKEKIQIQEFKLFPKNLGELSNKLVGALKINKALVSQLERLVCGFLSIIHGYDAELFEINPLIETLDHQLICADARLNIDDNSLFRHPEYQKNLQYYLNQLELKAKNVGMSYVELDGTIGVICNGAGLVMGTIDAVQSFGAKAANFLDVGGGADAVRMYQALQIIAQHEKVRVVLINIIGGITRCDEIAKGLIQFLQEKPNLKFVLRLIGTNEAEGQKLLEPYKITIYRNLNETLEALYSLIN